MRRPPLSLLFWRTVADLLFASQFLLTLFVQLSVSRETDGGVFWGRFPEYESLCNLMAFFTQFTAFASEMWLLMICVDLVLSLTQPFRQLKTNNHTYHAVVWLSSLATAAALLQFRMQGPSAIHICWVATDNTSAAALPDDECSEAVWSFSPSTIANWTLFYGWVVAILIFCVFVVVFATARLSEGLQATYEVRLGTIKDLRLYVGTGMAYWLVAATCYLLLLLNCYPDWTGLAPGEASAAVLWSSMGLTIALKGLVDALLWHSTAQRIVELELTRRTITGFDAEGAKMAGDTPFGVPEALREEWLDYTQLGIRTALIAAEEAKGTPMANLPARVLMLPSIRESAVSRTPSSGGPGSTGGAAGGGSCGASGPPSMDRLPRPEGWPSSSMLTAPLRTEEGRATERETTDDRCCEPGFSARWLNQCLARCIKCMAGGGPPFAFTEYHPSDFMRLRGACNVSSASYLASLLSGAQQWVRRTKEGKGGRWRFSEGRSGSFMYYTHDRALLVKTIDASEASVLRQNAPSYVRYMVAHPQSYLTRVYGTYSITMYNTTVHFVVMANIFAGAVPRAPGEPLMDERYDLKGSWIDRNSSRPKDPNTVKKDSDLNYCLHLSSDRLDAVRGQMSADVSFLSEQLHTMDYSLLIGVRRGRFIVNSEGGQTHYTPVDGPPSASPPIDAPPPSETADAAAAKPSEAPTEASAGPSPSPRASMNGSNAAFVGTVSPLVTSPINAPIVNSSGRLPRLSLGNASTFSDDALTAAEGAVTSGHLQPLLAPRTIASVPSTAAPNAAVGDAAASSLEAGAAGAVGAGDGLRIFTEASFSGGTRDASIELASIVEGPQSYHMGIIDMFQRWTIRKRLEHLAKRWVRCLNRHGISAIPPAEYAERFTERVIFDIFDAPAVPEGRPESGPWAPGQSGP